MSTLNLLDLLPAAFRRTSNDQLRSSRYDRPPTDVRTICHPKCLALEEQRIVSPSAGRSDRNVKIVVGGVRPTMFQEARPKPIERLRKTNTQEHQPTREAHPTALTTANCVDQSRRHDYQSEFLCSCVLAYLAVLCAISVQSWHCL